MKAKFNFKIILMLAILAIGAAVFVYFKLLKATSIQFVGTVEATKIEIPSRVASTIKQIEFVEGQSVKSGQSLVKLGCEDFEVQAELANDNFQRTQKLFKVGSATEDAFVNAKNKKRDADLKIQWCDIQSPVEGVVLSKNREVGEWVSPGSNIAVVADLNHVWMYVYVPHENLSDIKLSQSVQIFLKEGSEPLKVKALVEKINEDAEFTPKNVQTLDERTRLVFGVKISVENADHLLKPGMSVGVRFE
jgi:HlyD family secretion protein